MIVGHKSFFEMRLKERGYTLADVAACIVQQHGDVLVVDDKHPAYPHPKPAAPAVVGPGSQLKRLLAKVGIKATPNCPCNAYAAQMDSWGPDECEKRLEEIVGWLQAEAGRRKLPFVPLLARQLVRASIGLARKSARLAGT